jgi:hypothetical protein
MSAISIKIAEFAGCPQPFGLVSFRLAAFSINSSLRDEAVDLNARPFRRDASGKVEGDGGAQFVPEDGFDRGEGILGARAKMGRQCQVYFRIGARPEHISGSVSIYCWKPGGVAPLYWRYEDGDFHPDDVFEMAERLARRTKKSRSQLFSDAVKEYVSRHASEEVTDAINRVCAEMERQNDEFVSSATRRILERSEW